MDICLIGCGKMGSALLAGWQQDAGLDVVVHVVDPFITPSAARPGTHHVATVDDLPDGYHPSLVLLAVKPQMMADVLGTLTGLGDETTCFLSIAAGLSVARLSDQLGRPARWLRAMPNTPAAIGQGITALYAAPDVPAEMTALSHRLLSAGGDVVDLSDEGLMNAVTAVSGSGPAYVFLLAEVMAAAGEGLGLPADLAARLARQTVSGAGALMAADPQTGADQLRRNVTSEGGTTAAALSVLMADDGLRALFDRALRAAEHRGAELDS